MLEKTPSKKFLRGNFLNIFHGVTNTKGEKDFSEVIQKAVVHLLALLSLGIKNMYIGPTLPTFFRSNVLQYLVDTFGIRLISNAEDDIKTCLKQNI